MQRQVCHPGLLSHPSRAALPPRPPPPPPFWTTHGTTPVPPPLLPWFAPADDPSWAFIDPSGAAFFNLARDPLPAAPAAAEGAAAGGGAAVGGAAAAADGAAQATRVRAWYLAACALVARAWRGGGLAYEQRSGKVALRFHARLRRAFF